MLSKDNFSKEHIDELRAKYKRDPALLERTIYAFGMLEAITQVNLPFILSPLKKSPYTEFTNIIRKCRIFSGGVFLCLRDKKN